MARGSSFEHLDRAVFLSLTFGMAGAACNTGQSAVVANVVDIPAQPRQLGDAGAETLLVKGEDAGSKPVAAAGNDDTETDDELMDAMMGPTDENGVAVGSASNGCGFVELKTVVRPKAACAEDQGTAGSCNAMKSCPSFAFPKQKCEAYRRFFKPKVAQKAIDCLAKLTTKQTCDDACTTYRCGDLAIKTACPDPAADASCTQIIAKCPSVSMADCRVYLGGLNAAGRARMVSCLTPKSGCGFGIYSCSESLY